MEDLIRKFLAISSGYGYGDGDGDDYGYGSGDGDGDGYGYGDGSGYGSGDGDDYGDGDGYGYGDGDDIKTYNGLPVYMIDDTPTLIYSVHGQYACGSTLSKDLTTHACYIAKVGDYFAHGETLKQALADARDKYCRNKPLSERLAEFKSQYPSLDTVCNGADLFRWHNILTGSCLFGRRGFCREHGIAEPEKVTMTVSEFINLTANAFRGDVIKQLREIYN